MSGGECKTREPPPHVILGKTQSDQDWIDGEVETGVAVCGFERPKPRPASLDAPPATRQVTEPPVAKAAPKRKRLIQRVKERVWNPRAAPVVELPAIITQGPPPLAAAPTPPPAPPLPAQDPVDALLHPRR